MTRRTARIADRLIPPLVGLGVILFLVLVIAGVMNLVVYGGKL